MLSGYYGCLTHEDIGADVFDECAAVIALWRGRYRDMIAELHASPDDLDDVIKEIRADPDYYADAAALIIKDFPEAQLRFALPALQ
jgi:hypothetical protein